MWTGNTGPFYTRAAESTVLPGGSRIPDLEICAERTRKTMRAFNAERTKTETKTKTQERLEGSGREKRGAKKGTGNEECKMPARK
jgi:hypothetical protein